MRKPAFDYYGAAETISKRTRSNRIVRFFPNADLRCGHDGLRQWAKEKGDIEVWNLQPGEFVVFANTKGDRLKIYAPGNVIAYVKSPDERKIDLNVIRLIPRFFNGTEFKLDDALREMLPKKMRAA